MVSNSSKEIPEHIGVYQITEKIAEGGFGVVYKAFDPRLKRDVAIKVLHSQHSTEPTRVARFLREAQSAARINHPNIVQIYDIIEEDGKLALVMEFVSGESLDKFITHNPNLSLSERLQIAIQIAEALNVAHEIGVIHRDIKPANILIDEHLNVKLTDFNLARLLDTSLTPLTGDHNVLGTPAYMSPEQCQGKEATPQSDIYSFGVVMYLLFTGTLPFEGNNYLALMRHHMETPPTPVRIINPNLPISLEKLITQCLAKSPESRPSSAKEIVESLKSILNEITHKTIPTEPTDQPTIVLREPTPHLPESTTPPERTPAHTTYPITPPTPNTPLYGQPMASQGQHHPTGQSGEVIHTSSLPTQTPYTTPSPSQPYPQPQFTPIPQTQVMSPSPPSNELRNWEALYRRMGIIIIILFILTLISSFVSVYLAYKLSTQGNIQVSKEESFTSRSADTRFSSIEAPAQKILRTRETETSKILISYAKELDKNYNYRLHSKTKDAGVTTYFLELTSQAWHPEKVFPPIWRHWLTLIVPDRRTKDSALFVMTKGLSSIEKPMSEVPLSLLSIAVSTNSIVAILEGFPIDSTGYYETPSKKVELNDINFFVWTLRQYYDTGDPNWIILLPMVKSAVSAMNAVQEFVLKELQSEIPVKEFVVCADVPFFAPWLIPAVDDRVIGIIGINNFVYNIESLIKTCLIDEITIPPLFEAIDNQGLLQNFETEEGEKLLNIIDPYNYRQFMRITKLIISYNGSATSNFSFYAEDVLPEIPDPTYWALYPQVSLSREPIYLSQSLKVTLWENPIPPKMYNFKDTLSVFYQRVISRKELPTFTWNIAQRGKCSVKVSEEIVDARVWYCIQDAKNKLFENTSEWQVETMTEIGEGIYEADLNFSDENYKAVVIEIVFPSLSGTNFPITSHIHIIPPAKSDKQSSL